MPVASPTAVPPDEPPDVLSGSNGLQVAPNKRLRVLPPAPNSGVFVLPIMMPPSRCRAATEDWSRSGMFSAKSSEPKVVRRPFVTSKSFTPTGRPCNRPSSSPSFMALSAFLAALRAAAKLSVTTAFNIGFSASIRWMLASTSSLEDNCFVRSRTESSVAGSVSTSCILSILFSPDFP